MKTQELRVGNLVKNDYSQIRVVNSIAFNPLILDYAVSFPDGEFEALDLLQPIPLTEEWFVKFGFKKDDNGNYWRDLITNYLEIMQSGEYFFPSYIQIPEFSFENENRVSLNRIQHVHQLQNLYYALTGEELL
jgi:hypothetical protein